MGGVDSEGFDDVLEGEAIGYLRERGETLTGRGVDEVPGQKKRGADAGKAHFLVSPVAELSGWRRRIASNRR